MSRTHKRFIPHYRSTKGQKQAKITQKLYNTRPRAIPPGQWDDTKADKQCYFYYNLINKMFLKGYETSEIRRKLRLRGVKSWQWKEYCQYLLDSVIKIEFVELVALNDSKTEIISISTPEAEPLLAARVDGIPTEKPSYIVVDKRSIHIYTYLTYDDPYHSIPIKVNEVKLLPHKTLTNIMLYVDEMFKSNGMKHDYLVEQWERGLGFCKITPIDREESFII